MVRLWLFAGACARGWMPGGGVPLRGPRVRTCLRGSDVGVSALNRRRFHMASLHIPPSHRQHYIPHCKSDMVAGRGAVPRGERRVSFTLRRVRRSGDACTCPFPAQCDSQGGGLPPTRASLASRNGGRGATGTVESLDAPEGAAPHPASPPWPCTSWADLETRHVANVYDAIASHFSATRCRRAPCRHASVVLHGDAAVDARRRGVPVMLTTCLNNTPPAGLPSGPRSGGS